MYCKWFYYILLVLLTAGLVSGCSSVTDISEESTKVIVVSDISEYRVANDKALFVEFFEDFLSIETFEEAQVTLAEYDYALTNNLWDDLCAWYTGSNRGSDIYPLTINGEEISYLGVFILSDNLAQYYALCYFTCDGDSITTVSEIHIAV